MRRTGETARRATKSGRVEEGSQMHMGMGGEGWEWTREKAIMKSDIHPHKK
jgi:hypothetical protein